MIEEVEIEKQFHVWIWKQGFKVAKNLSFMELLLLSILEKSSFIELAHHIQDERVKNILQNIKDERTKKLISKYYGKKISTGLYASISKEQPAPIK